MKSEHIDPFVTAMQEVLGQFGILGIEKESVTFKEEMIIDQDITAFIGIVGDLNGNVSYCFSKEVAKKVASIMMMGMPIEEIDEMVRSALAELANMITGNAASILSGIEMNLDITPPSLIAGEEMFFILTFLETVTIVLTTPIGNIEMNIALER